MHGRPQDRTAKPQHGAQGSTDSQTVDPSLATNRGSGDDPGRLSTTSMQSSGREPHNDSHRSSVTDARFSESSRSDQSLGEHGIQRTFSPNEGSTSSSKRFRMPRLKRNRAPLFPLPPKPTGAQSANGRRPTLPKTTTGDSNPKSDISDEQEQDHVSPLPSPSRSSAVLSSSPGQPLFRNDSATSARSVNSTASNRNRAPQPGRERASTMDSLPDIQDGHRPNNLASSGRTSTSTSGRKSFGDIFSIPQRLRQNSEPVSRIGSPGAGGPGGLPKAGSSLSRTVSSHPEREENDTPASYLARLEQSIPRGAIAGVLSQSPDEFYKTGLRKYMRGFAFFCDPIDMAIRKLLMEVELPKETQQIDRFIQAFADRYHECNPGIFASTGMTDT